MKSLPWYLIAGLCLVAMVSTFGFAQDKPLVVNKYDMPIRVSEGDNFHVVPFLTKENAPKANTYQGLVTIKPGTKIPTHTHGDVFETLYIISGGGKFIIEDKTYRGSPGSFVYFPAQMKHSFINDLDENMVVVQTYAPAGTSEMRFFQWPTWDQIMEKAKSGDVLK